MREDEGGPWSVLAEQGACARLCEAVASRGGGAADCAALVRARQTAPALVLADLLARTAGLVPPAPC